MDTESTTAFLNQVFRAWHNSGDMSYWLGALAEDIKWTIAGAKENAGLYEGKQNYIDNVLGKLDQWVKRPPVPTLRKLIVNDDWATAWLKAEAEALDGKKFEVEYCWLIRVSDRKVVEVIGFYA